MNVTFEVGRPGVGFGFTEATSKDILPPAAACHAGAPDDWASSRGAAMMPATSGTASAATPVVTKKSFLHPFRASPTWLLMMRSILFLRLEPVTPATQTIGDSR